MAREYRILHHRQAGSAGGHWDLVENPIPFRASLERVPHGDGSLCAALSELSTQGWTPSLVLAAAHAQSGETFILIWRDTQD